MPAMLSDADLTSLAALAQNLALRDTCTILNVSRVRNASGGYVDTYVPQTSTVPCAIIDLRKMGMEQVKGGALESATIKMMLFPRGTVILDTDRLQVVSATSGTTTIYEVTAAFDPTTFEIVRRVEVNRLGQGAS